MIIPRDYQIACVDSIYNFFQTEEGNPLLALPTGTGKSIVIACFLEGVLKKWPTQKVMVLTHVKELIKQNYEKMLAVWPFAPAGIYSAGLNRRDVHNSIIFAGIASVAKRWQEFRHIDLVIIDEAHLLSPNDTTMYQKFLEGLKSVNPKLKVIGLTATPYRLGHGHIADGTLFHKVAFDMTTIEAFNWLIAQGYMSMLIPRKMKTELDIDGVHIRGGEFIAGELQAAVDKNEVTYAALQETLSVAYDRKHWLIFASGVEHAIHITDMLKDMDIPCEAIHSKMDGRDRDKFIEQFKRGELKALVNNNILTTGFDSPWIDLIVCLRPTASSVLWVQMLGRGTRPYLGDHPNDSVPKENCLVLDFASNTKRLGPINDPVIPHKKGAGGGEAPVKECPVCDTINHAAVRNCIFCGYTFPIEVKIKSEAGTIDLIKGDMPKTGQFKVDHITCRQYMKPGRPPMMKVTYFCGLRSFEEYICFEHTNYAGKVARDWWRARTDFPVPSTVKEALHLVGELPAATHLNVWLNKKPYPQILKTCFDGSAFGTQIPDTDLPKVEVNEPTTAIPSSNIAAQDKADLDADIPF